MVVLFREYRDGAYELRQPADLPQWQQVIRTAKRLLQVRGSELAFRLLDELPFVLYVATDWAADWEDEFYVLVIEADVEKYVELERGVALDSFLSAGDWAPIPKAISDASEWKIDVRFIVARLVDDPVKIVPSPSPVEHREVIRLTLEDVDRALQAGRPAALLVDRMHTALHGYLNDLCATLPGDPLPADGSFQAAFSRLQQKHPALAYDGARPDAVKEILRGCAKILEGSNTIRNKASASHPHDALLPEPEALLVINVMRSVFHYVASKTGP